MRLSEPPVWTKLGADPEAHRGAGPSPCSILIQDSTAASASGQVLRSDATRLVTIVAQQRYLMFTCETLPNMKAG